MSDVISPVSCLSPPQYGGALPIVLKGRTVDLSRRIIKGRFPLDDRAGGVCCRGVNHRRERGHPLTPDIIRCLSPGDVIRVVSKSWHIPFDDPFFNDYDFKFDSLGEANGDGERIVRGQWRMAYSHPRDKHEFRIGPDGATTNDAAGDIRGLVRNGVDNPLKAALERGDKRTTDH